MVTPSLTEILNICQRSCVKVLVSLRLLWEMVGPLVSGPSRSKLGLWTCTIAMGIGTPDPPFCFLVARRRVNLPHHILLAMMSWLVKDHNTVEPTDYGLNN